jgi:two-component sensor histidine kinase
VRIRVELHDPDARLFSTRAITLAMVLHELAYNALEHGLHASGGELLVRSRAPGDGARIAIDVVDRAAVNALAARRGADGHVRRTAHAGIGLQLVRNLVARELGGRFALDRTDCGTTATVEFSLEQEAECHP